MPEYFALVANDVFDIQGGAHFSASNVQALLQIEQQVKRVMLADPSQNVNVSALRS